MQEISVVFKPYVICSVDSGETRRAVVADVLVAGREIGQVDEYCGYVPLMTAVDNVAPWSPAEAFVDSVAAICRALAP